MTDSPWIENTGMVPDGVGPDTKIEVEYRDGEKMVWPDGRGVRNNSHSLWSFSDPDDSDIIRWRFV